MSTKSTYVALWV